MVGIARLLLMVVILTYVVVVWTQSRGIEWRGRPNDPSIYEHPQDPTVYDKEKAKSEGINYANLTCKAKARPWVNYAWLKDGKEIQISDKYTIAGGYLVIYNPTYPDDEGLYQCIAYNPRGADVSTPAWFLMTHVGEFDKSPRSQVTVTEGRGFKVECGAPDGFPALYYGWYKGHVANRIIPNERRYISHKNGDLYFKYAVVNDAGNYRCFVQNQQETDFAGDLQNRSSPIITVIVNRDLNPPISDREPVIMLAPQDTTVIEGYLSAELECFDDAYPESNIQWKRLDRPAREGGVEIAFPSKARFNYHSHALIIPLMSAADGGIFQCTASNRKGSVSHEAQIEVRSVPSPKVPRASKALVFGGSVTMSCEATGSEPLVYSWYFKRDKIVTDNIKYVVSTDKLTVKNMDLGDRGGYRCIVSNQQGAGSAEVKLLAKGPNIIIPISQQNGMEGSTITMTVRFAGLPVPTMEWIKQGEVIATRTPEGVVETTSPRYDVTRQGYLIIKNLTPDDAGSYSFRIQNVLDSKDTAGILYVAKQSRIIRGPGPTDVNMEQGGTTIIPCEGQIDSLLESVNTWFVDGRKIDFVKESFNYKRGPKGELIIKNANVMMHDGVYTCALATTADEQTATGRVRIKGVSEAPVGVKFENVGSNTATLRFTQANTNGDSCKEYVVEAQTEFDDIFFTDRLWTQVWRGSPSALRSSRGGAKLLNLNNLKPYTEYSFRVMCLNTYGMGEPSWPTEKNRTLPGAPPRAPRKLGYGNGMAGDVLMSWEPLEESDWGDYTVGYRVRYRRQGTGDKYRVVYIDNPEAAAYAHTQPPAPVNVPYECKIAAYNNYSVGPEATWIAYSSSGLPDYPRNLEIIKQTNNSVTMQWDKIPNFNGPIPFWGVRYWREEDRPRAARRNQTIFKRAVSYWWDTWLRYIPEQEEEDETGFQYARLYDDGLTKLSGPAGKETYILRGLQPSTLYNFQVRANSHPYFGEYSNITRAITLRTGNPWLQGLRGTWWIPMLFWLLVTLLIVLLLTLCCCCCLWCNLRQRDKPKNELFLLSKRNWKARNYEVDVMTDYHKGLLKQFRDTIIRYVSPNPVTDHLVTSDALPQTIAGQIEQIEDPDLANERLLDILPYRPDFAFDRFCDGFRPEHPWLSDLLEEAEEEMTDEHRSILQTHQEALAATVDPHPVISHMKENKYFNPMEEEDLMTLSSKEETNNTVIEMLKDRPDPAFYHYLMCLEKQDPDLAAKIGGPDCQVDIKKLQLDIENRALMDKAMRMEARMPPSLMVADGKYDDDDDKSGKHAGKDAESWHIDMPMLSSLDDFKMSKTVAVEPVGDKKMSNMVAVEPGELKMSNMDSVDTPTISSILDGVLPPPDTQAAHPFESQSGSTIEVENANPIIIEIVGDAKSVRWLREGIPLPNDEFYQQTTEGEDLHSLFIAKVTEQNQGCYTCEGTTEHGVVHCDIFIKVREPRTEMASLV
ncbi:contactin-2-like [Branchiostoma floridae]|uniref:Contactin-2-like n=1 Tax=Branchiostoma floridae TaxID=7739 RepID=A0A9J7LT45_BRAFL|nr:contactin-2-like [Branchiostoma floridae]